MNDISREGTGEPTADEAVAGLGRMLYDLWRFGSNALVGWQATSWGIEVVTVPKVRFFAAQNPPRRAFLGDRRMGTHTFNDVATAFGVQPVGLRLDRPVGDEDNAIPYSAVERVFSRYAITKTDQRAVFLIDVVGFSKLTPEQQGSQLATIEFALNLAAETAIDHGMAVDMARSTTGDGFYVWNREKGFRADLATGVVMALFLTYLGALKRQIVIPLAVPSIRAAYSIGSHYSYSQPRPNDDLSVEYIVGEVTIGVARIIGRARGEQILVGDFARHQDDASAPPYPAAAFVDLIGRELSRMTDIPAIGGRVARFALYLTGPRGADGTYRPQKLKVIDKHGFEHLCYNAKLNIHPEQGEPIFIGIQHADLVNRPPGS